MENTNRTDGPMKVVLCGCGRMYLTCGPITLHFERDEFLAFASTVARRAAIVYQQPAGLAPTLRPGAQSEVCH